MWVQIDFEPLPGQEKGHVGQKKVTAYAYSRGHVKDDDNYVDVNLGNDGVVARISIGKIRDAEHWYIHTGRNADESCVSRRFQIEQISVQDPSVTFGADITVLFVNGDTRLPFLFSYQFRDPKVTYIMSGGLSYQKFSMLYSATEKDTPKIEDPRKLPTLWSLLARSIAPFSPGARNRFKAKIDLPAKELRKKTLEELAKFFKSTETII